MHECTKVMSYISIIVILMWFLTSFWRGSAQGPILTSGILPDGKTNLSLQSSLHNSPASFKEIHFLARWAAFSNQPSPHGASSYGKSHGIAMVTTDTDPKHTTWDIIHYAEATEASWHNVPCPYHHHMTTIPRLSGYRHPRVRAHPIITWPPRQLYAPRLGLQKLPISV